MVVDNFDRTKEKFPHSGSDLKKCFDGRGRVRKFVEGLRERETLRQFAKKKCLNSQSLTKQK